MIICNIINNELLIGDKQPIAIGIILANCII